MYFYKPIDFGFVILCVDCNTPALRNTIRSIRNFYPNASCTAVIPNKTSKDEIKLMSEICPILKGKDTISSLINKGLDKSKSDWNFLIFSGTHIKPRFALKYQFFIENEKDILFPIVDRKFDFVSGSMNGILMHKNAMSEIGKFDNADDIELVKLGWAISAIDKGYKFKALIGARVV